MAKHYLGYRDSKLDVGMIALMAGEAMKIAAAIMDACPEEEPCSVQ